MSSPEQLTNRAGVVVFDGTAAPGGGSQPLPTFPLAFNTPGLVLTGVNLFTAATDLLLAYNQSAIFCVTPWDGTFPVLHFGIPGNLTALDGGLFNGPNLDTAAPNPFVTGFDVAWFDGSGGLAPAPSLLIAAGTTVTAMVDDGSGNDPGSTMGACRVVLTALPL